MEALRSRASERPSAANVRLVSIGTSDKASAELPEASPKPKFDEGRLSVGREGGTDTGDETSSSSTSGTRDFCGLSVDVALAGDPFVTSESSENRETGFPRESLEKRSG